MKKAKVPLIDELIVKEIFFPDERAVILDINEIAQKVHSQQLILDDIDKKVSRPPFDAMCLEWDMNDLARQMWLKQNPHTSPPNGRYNIQYMMYIETIRNIDNQKVIGMLKKRLKDDMNKYTIYVGIVIKNYFGIIEQGQNIAVLVWDEYGVWDTEKSYVLIFSENDNVTKLLDVYTAISIEALSYCHVKNQVELVEYARNHGRRIARKQLGGKKPSPYFRIDIAPNKIRREGGGSPKNKVAQLPVHTVRGHFKVMPDDHPLPQFAGKTFWTPSHSRGNKGEGSKKSYRVILGD